MQGNCSADEVFASLLELLDAEKPQLVMLAMAPNMSGIAEVDHDRGMYLVELSLDFAEKTLAEGGDFW